MQTIIRLFTNNLLGLIFTIWLSLYASYYRSLFNDLTNNKSIVLYLMQHYAPSYYKLFAKQQYTKNKNNK